jgi:lipopolysaccharide export system protein LptA
MSKALFTVNIFLAAITVFLTVFATSAYSDSKSNPIVITADTLVADNKKNTAVFKGSVVATSEDIKMFSDEMTVFYQEEQNGIARIHATGNIHVQKEDISIFSNEATYIDAEEKIVFTGDSRIIENDNSIEGTKIIYFLKDERAVVEGSKVHIQNKPEL